jgi:hypothetical protein
MGRFTAGIVEGIETGTADWNGDGQISLSDIKQYLEGSLRGQTPQFFAYASTGDPLISLNPKSLFLALTALREAPSTTTFSNRQRAQSLALAHSVTDGSAFRYFDEAAALRVYLELAWEDHKYAEDGRTIVYIVDANVVGLFVYPDREASYTIAFGNPVTSDYAFATAVITAESLFSGTLAGQGNMPPLIAPAHAEEIAALINLLERETHHLSEVQAGSLDNRFVAHFRALNEQLESGTIELPRVISELRQLFPNATKTIFDESWAGSQQLLRLFQEDRLRPLAAHACATREILAPDPAIVAQWINRIGHERKPSNSEDRRRVHYDAEVLTQTLALNEGADGTVCYLLITADKALHQAYAKWYFENRPDLFCLRTPLQYTPIINFAGERDILVAKQTAEALDSLFVPVRVADPQLYPKSLLLYTERYGIFSDGSISKLMQEFFGFHPADIVKENAKDFVNLREQWDDASRVGVILRSSLITRRVAERFANLAKLVYESDNLVQALYENQRQTIQRIQQIHSLMVGDSARRPLREGRHQ